MKVAIVDSMKVILLTKSKKQISIFFLLKIFKKNPGEKSIVLEDYITYYYIINRKNYTILYITIIKGYKETTTNRKIFF